MSSGARWPPVWWRRPLPRPYGGARGAAAALRASEGGGVYGSSLPALGNSLSLDYPGRRSVAPSKLLRYLDEGHSLIDDTADAKPVAQKRLMLPS